MLYFRKVCLLATVILAFGASDLFAQDPVPSGISVRIHSPADSAWVGIGKSIVVDVHSQHLLSGISASSANDTTFTVRRFYVALAVDTSSAEGLNPGTWGGQYADAGSDPLICAVSHYEAGSKTSGNRKTVTWTTPGAGYCSKVTAKVQSSTGTTHTARYTFQISTNLASQIGVDFRAGVTGVYAMVATNVLGDAETLGDHETAGTHALASSSPGAVYSAGGGTRGAGGDGKFVSIDTGRPIQTAARFDSVVVAGKEADASFKIGSTIEAVAAIANLTGVADVEAIELGLFGFDGDYVPAYMSNRDSALVKSLKRFPIKDGAIQGASGNGKTLRNTVTVEENAFKIVGDPDDDDSYDADEKTTLTDNLRFKVAAFFVDRAGNIGSATIDGSAEPFSGDRVYTVDSKRPVIKIKHPVAVDDPDSNRFTGLEKASFAHYRNNNGTTGLNNIAHRPLELNVHEMLDSLRATIKTPKDSLVHADITDEGNFISDTKIATNGMFQTAGGDILPSSEKGGQKVELMIRAKDQVGNVSTVTVKDVIFDEDEPDPTNLFPEMADLSENTINNQTRHPIVRFDEALDSLSVRFVQNIGTSPHQINQPADVGALTVGEDATVTVNRDLRDDLTYVFQLFVRDLAGNVHVSKGDTLKFEEDFKNPPANMFVVETKVGNAKADSVIAGGSLTLTITAVDSVQRNANKNRGTAVTHRREVRVSAWDGDEMASSVTFSGGGAAKNEDGTYSVPASGWNAGVLTGVKAKSNLVLDDFTIRVEDVSALGGDVSEVVNFMGEKTGLYVDANQMTKFVVTAWEDGEEAKTVSGEFGVNVKPTDKFGNPSIKMLTGDDALDTRIDDNRLFTNFSVKLEASHPRAEVPGAQPMTLAGKTFTVIAPNANGSGLTITAEVAGVSAGASSKHLIATGSVTVDYTGVAPAASDSLAGPAYLKVMDVENDQGHRVLVIFPLSSDHAEVDEYRLYRQYDIGDGRGMQFIQWGEAFEPSGADSVVTYPVGVPDAMATHWAIEAIGAKPSSPTVSGKLSAAVVASPRTLTAEPVAALDNMPPEAATNVMLDANTISWTLSPSEGPTTETYTNSWTGQAGIAIPGVTGYEIMVGLSEDAMNSVGKVGAGVSSFALSAEAIAPLIVAGVITQEQLAQLIATDLLGVMVRVDALDVSNSVPSMIYTVVEMGRREFTSADGDPVYLVVLDGDMTVGFDDFMAFAAAFNTRDGDDAWNVQADLNDDGTVDFADFILFVQSYGMTAQGPSSKPVILPPGVNENAEFSLRLGSERVVVGQNVFVDVSLANVQALMGYGFVLNYDADKFEFVEAAPTDQDLLKSTGGETPLFSSIANGSGQVSIANAVVNGSEISGGGDIVRLTFRVLQEFSENARFEIAEGLVFDPQQLSNPAVVAGVLDVQTTPTEFALLQNFPNPFNPETTIGYELAESADVTLQIYNVVGQVVRTLIAAESQAAGRYQIRWDGMDDRGVSVSSGIYFYRISAGEFQTVRKLMLLK